VIRVTTPSRLHLSLVDLEGGLGRVDGGIGLALEKPGVEVVVEKADGLEVSGAGRDVAEKVLLHYKLAGARVEVKRMTDGHVGLGSRTQLALAIAAGITREYGVDATTRELARVVGRGGTSGVGVSVF